MPESYQQAHRELDVEDANLWSDDENGTEGFVSGAKIVSTTSMILESSATASNDFSKGSVGVLSSAGTITLADASDVATTNLLVVMALETVAGGESGNFQLPFGTKVTVTGHGFTIGAPLYVSETSGGLTNTAPGASAYVRPVAYAINANELLFIGNGTTIAGS